MRVYQIQGSPAERHYVGCGEALAGLQGDTVLHIRYQHQFTQPYEAEVEWLQGLEGVTDVKYGMCSCYEFVTQEKKPIHVEIKTNTYNERRMGRPWIANVNFKDNPKGDFQWGQWIGSPGSSGLLVIDADAGDILSKGQKDHRKPRYSVVEYGVVNPDGTINWDIDKVEAYQLANAKETA
jgi:hypothetical protein